MEESESCGREGEEEVDGEVGGRGGKVGTICLVKMLKLEKVCCECGFVGTEVVNASLDCSWFFYA